MGITTNVNPKSQNHQQNNNANGTLIFPRTSGSVSHVFNTMHQPMTVIGSEFPAGVVARFQVSPDGNSWTDWMIHNKYVQLSQKHPMQWVNFTGHYRLRLVNEASGIEYAGLPSTHPTVRTYVSTTTHERDWDLVPECEPKIKPPCTIKTQRDYHYHIGVGSFPFKPLYSEAGAPFSIIALEPYAGTLGLIVNPIVEAEHLFEMSIYVAGPDGMTAFPSLMRLTDSAGCSVDITTTMIEADTGGGGGYTSCQDDLKYNNAGFISMEIGIPFNNYMTHAVLFAAHGLPGLDGSDRLLNMVSTYGGLQLRAIQLGASGEFFRIAVDGNGYPTQELIDIFNAANAAYVLAEIVDTTGCAIVLNVPVVLAFVPVELG